MPDGNSEQTRMIAEKVAEQMIAMYGAPPKRTEPEIPPIIKWLVGAIGAFGSAAIIGLGIWLVTSVSTMSNTLARMDERMKGSDNSVQSELNELRRRVTANEALLREGSGR